MRSGTKLSPVAGTFLAGSDEGETCDWSRTRGTAMPGPASSWAAPCSTRASRRPGLALEAGAIEPRERVGASRRSSSWPPVTDPDKIVCLGLNYRDHAAESGLALPKAPMLFAKFRNSLTGPDAPIVLPSPRRAVRLRGRAGGRDRPPRQGHRGRGRARARRGRDGLQRRHRARRPARDVAVDGRQGDRHVRAVRARAGHARRARRPAGPRDPRPRERRRPCRTATRAR